MDDRPADRLDLEPLEPVRRGVYCGAVGWVDGDRGRTELAVAIRTFTISDGRTHLGVGGGIVADSEPDEEWVETELKAARLLTAAFGVGSVVRISRVFECVRFMMFMMRVFFFLFFASFCRGRLDGGRIGQGYRRQRLAGVNLGALVLRVIVLIVGMFVAMPVFMIVTLMVMILGIGVVMFGVVRVTVFGVQAFQVFVVVMRLSGLRGIGAGVLDHLALDALATAAAARIAVARTAAVGAVLGFLLGLAMGAFVSLDQRLTIGDRNLIIIGVDFAEGQKAVTVAAIFDEGGLQ